MTSSIERLRRDQRGAIMIFGVVMGMILVGALWHLASIGNAIAWRERAQDAADAAAFENAVWHARGMNLLVSLNLIMQVVLAVLVFWRIVLVIVGLVVVLSTVLCVFTAGLGCGVTEAAITYADKVKKVDNMVAKIVTKTLGVMRVAQFAVSDATPALAFHFSGSHTKDAFSGITDATTWSASIIPSLNLTAVKDMKACFSKSGGEEGGDEAGGDEAGGGDKTGGADEHDKGGAGDGAGDKAGGSDKGGGDSGGDGGSSGLQKILGGLNKASGIYNDWIGNPRFSMPLSLPVQAAEFSVLCGKSGGLIVDAFGDVLDLIGLHGLDGPLKKASGIVEGIVKSAPTVFCMPVSETGPLKDALQDLDGEFGKKCKDDIGKDPANVVSGSDPKDPKYHEYGKKNGKPVSKDDWLKGCEKAKKKEASDKLNESIEESNEAAEACGKPLEVWAFASNGNVFMRSFSSVDESDPMSARDARGISMAAEGNGAVAAITTDDIGAHSEMYFDCEEGWEGCKEEAMWNLKWEARLRRVQPFPVLASTAVEAVAVETLTKLADTAVSKALDGILHDHLHIRPNLVPSVKNIYGYEQLKDKGKGFLSSHLGLEGVQETLVKRGGSNSIIH